MAKLSLTLLTLALAASTLTGPAAAEAGVAAPSGRSLLQRSYSGGSIVPCPQNVPRGSLCVKGSGGTVTVLNSQTVFGGPSITGASGTNTNGPVSVTSSSTSIGGRKLLGTSYTSTKCPPGKTGYKCQTVVSKPTSGPANANSNAAGYNGQGAYSSSVAKSNGGTAYATSTATSTSAPAPPK